MAEAEETNGKNKCGCLKAKPHKRDGKDCTDTHCKLCKVCCAEDCPGCKKCKEEGKCLCRLVRCACPKNCYGTDGDDSQCKGSKTCVRCDKRCSDKRLGDRCICANCNCGCGYGLCNCCPWCKRNYCTGNCNGYVIGRCKEKGEKECKGHYAYYGDDELPLNKRNDSNVSPAIAQEYKNNMCLYKCTACGRLCVKHLCHCIGSVIIIIGASVFIIFIAWNKYPEKFRKVYYDLRGALGTAPVHPGRSLSDLVAGRIPDVNVDRYPAFRPRTYAGLS